MYPTIARISSRKNAKMGCCLCINGGIQRKRTRMLEMAVFKQQFGTPETPEKACISSRKKHFSNLGVQAAHENKWFFK